MAVSLPNLSPFLITLIGITSTAFMLMIYHYIVNKWCNGRTQGVLRAAQQGPPFSSGEEMVSGLDSYSIQLIPALKYGKEVSIEGGECAVCLCEFKEGEEVRQLPECLHSFHVPCIDMWLSSHTSCPLCRSDMAPSPSPHEMMVPEGHTRAGLPNIARLSLRRDKSCGGCPTASTSFTSRASIGRCLRLHPNCPLCRAHIQTDQEDQQEEVAQQYCRVVAPRVI
ncbi:hypothetical protein ACLOJK_012897 [Asimina triloba]